MTPNTQEGNPKCCPAFCYKSNGDLRGLQTQDRADIIQELHDFINTTLF